MLHCWSIGPEPSAEVLNVLRLRGSRGMHAPMTSLRSRTCLLIGVARAELLPSLRLNHLPTNESTPWITRWQCGGDLERMVEHNTRYQRVPGKTLDSRRHPEYLQRELDIRLGIPRVVQQVGGPFFQLKHPYHTWA